jgi:hypothetical protein
VAAWLGGVVVLSPDRSDAAETVPLSARLAQLFTDPRSAEIIGAAYLKAADAAEAAPERLIRAISDGEAAFATLPEIAKAIRARIRRDFAEGAVVIVDGWMLSRTEARLCALISSDDSSARCFDLASSRRDAVDPS